MLWFKKIDANISESRFKFLGFLVGTFLVTLVIVYYTSHVLFYFHSSSNKSDAQDNISFILCKSLCPSCLDLITVDSKGRLLASIDSNRLTTNYSCLESLVEGMKSTEGAQTESCLYWRQTDTDSESFAFFFTLLFLPFPKISPNIGLDKGSPFVV